MITLIKSNSNTGKKSLRHLSPEAFILQIKRENPYVRQLRRFVEDVLETPGETHGSFSDLDKIPRVYPSIVHRRKERDIFPTEEYNGIIMLEVNQLTGMAEAKSIKQQAAVLPSTLAAFVGSSGRSVKIWVRYALPDGLLPKGLVQIEAFHKEACLIALGCYSSILSQSPEVKDVTSMTSCCVTEDTHPLFYPEALTADTILQELTSKSERTQLGVHYNVTFGRLLRKLNVPVRHTKYGNAYRCVRL